MTTPTDQPGRWRYIVAGWLLFAGLLCCAIQPPVELIMGAVFFGALAIVVVVVVAAIARTVARARGGHGG